MGWLKQCIINTITNNRLLWKLINPFIRISDALKRQYEIKSTEKLSLNLFEKVFSNNLYVKNGFFSGMKYPFFKSYGSSILPKLLGSYEYELSPIIQEIIAKQYNTIIDVGCAEGYYAIGLAMKTNARVYAFDINEQARDFCLKMSELNNVNDKIIIGSFCDEKTLCDFDFGNKTLIICDCEGYEKKLFTDKNIKNLKTCDLLIEIHDHLDIDISYYIEQLFTKTHQIKKIKSTDDIEKIRKYNFKELESLSFDEKKLLLSEGRPNIMDWYWITPIL